MARFKKILKYEIVFTFIMLVLLMSFGLFIKNFFSEAIFRAWTWPFTILAIVTLGQSVVMAAGNWDLSVGSVFSLAGILSGIMIINGFNPILTLIICLMAGVILGLLNGFLVVNFRLPSFAITIGTMAVFRGAAAFVQKFVFHSESPVNFNSPSLTNFAHGQTSYWVAPSLFLMIGLVVLLTFFFRKTNTGLSLLAIGGNANASRASGLKVNKMIIISFAVCSVFAALAGVLFATGTRRIDPTTGSGLELQSIVAVIFGGAALYGGRVSIIGSTAACILIAVVTTLLTVLGITNFITNLIGGLLLLSAMIITNLFQIQQNNRIKAKVKEISN